MNDRFTLETRITFPDPEKVNDTVRKTREIVREICTVEAVQEIKSSDGGDDYAELTPVRGTKFLLEDARAEMVIDRTGH